MTAIVVLLFAATAAHGAGRTVSFRSLDGRTINGLLFEPAQRPAPAAILVPMLGRPKEDWDAVGQRIADANVFAFAVDLPGLTDPGDARTLGEWGRTVESAVTYLASRSDVRGGSIGLVGASLGASLAAIAASSDTTIRSLVLVSPAMDYHGVRLEGPMRQYGGRPALLLASSHDPYAVRTIRELTKDSPGIREARLAETTGHGTVLLARDDEMVRLLVEWLQRTLGN